MKHKGKNNRQRPATPPSPPTPPSVAPTGENPKKGGKGSRKKEDLSCKEIFPLLTPAHDAIVAQCVKLALYMARGTALPDAEAVAFEGLTRAVATFRCESERECFLSMLRWTRLKVKYALRNLAAEYPASEVRDAFIEFEQRHGYRPTLLELCRFGVFNPRHVLNVWEGVAQELNLTGQTDTVCQSFTEEIAGWNQVPAPFSSEESERVQKALAELPPVDSCLIVLRDMCRFSEQEIFDFLVRARLAASQGATQDDFEDMLDQFVHEQGVNVSAPWDSDLLTFYAHGKLATKLSRARRKYKAAWKRLGGF